MTDLHKNSVTLKWGTLKGWNLHTEDAMDALRLYKSFGTSMSLAMQDDTPEQRDALIALIRHADEIWLDWEGKQVTRDEAIKYVQEYGNRPT